MNPFTRLGGDKRCGVGLDSLNTDEMPQFVPTAPGAYHVTETSELPPTELSSQREQSRGI